MDCYIFDVDGTITDLEHRRHHVREKPRDWAAFNAKMGDDSPVPHIVKLIRHIHWAGQTIILCTGRQEANRPETEEWLMKHDVPYFSLYMRPTGDYRDDVDVKSELLAKILGEGWRPIMAFDDRNKVVAMWRRLGMPCAQVAEGDF